jgi:hypothetical protein
MNTTTKRQRLTRHLDNLTVIFGRRPRWATLCWLERRAHRLAERQCNEPLPEGFVERLESQILSTLDDATNYRARGIKVFLNGDSRGYAIKIEDEQVRDENMRIERDWGGYGIIAPEFE